MQPVKVLTGSSATITPEIAAQYGIGLVPYQVTYSGKTCDDGVNLDYDDFHRFLRAKEGFPKTSHPSLGAFKRAFIEAAKRSHTIVYVSISSIYSEAYSVALAAAEELKDLDIEVVDSEAGAGGQTMVALEAACAAAEGSGREAVLGMAEAAKVRTDVAMTLETTRYLAHSGRMHRSSAVMGSLLSVKPVIACRDDAMTVIAKPHTHSEALSVLEQMMKSEYSELSGGSIRCIIEDVDNEEWADRAEEMVKSEFPIDKLWRIRTSATIAAHVGPGAWGITWYVVP